MARSNFIPTAFIWGKPLKDEFDTFDLGIKNHLYMDICLKKFGQIILY